MATYIHPNAIVDSNVSLGAGTRIWAFSHVLRGATIGKNCNVCDHTFIEGKVIIGDNVTVKSGVYIWDGAIIEDDVFVGPCVAFTNDARPRSKQYPGQFFGPRLRRGCSIGANATLLPNVEIGEWAMIGAGSVVTKSVKAHSLVYGNSAQFRGWVCECGNQLPDSNAEEIICKCGYSFKLIDNELVKT